MKKIMKKSLKKIIDCWKSDVNNYCKQNTDENRVVDAHYFSRYKDAWVIKLPIGRNAFSFGFIGLGRRAIGVDLIRHEYGHYLQLKKRGTLRYFFYIAIPSITANILKRMNRLPYDYYGSPWEHEADILGGVENRNAKLWPQDFSASYVNLLKLFIFRQK